MSGGERLPIIIPLLDDKEAASVDELDDHLLLLEMARHRLDIEWCESVGTFEDKGGHHCYGYPNLVAYLKGRVRVAAARANRYVNLARAARRFQATFAAWRLRHITSDQAELLFQASRRLPDKYPDAERVLLEIAGDSVENTRRMLDYWSDSVDRPGATLDFETQMARRHFDITRRSNGMIEGKFSLTKLAGESFLTAMDGLMPPPTPGDPRTATQRRHDAFEDLARGFLDGASAPQVGGERPHLNLLVDVNTLRGIPGGIHETDDGHVLDIDTIRQLACDCIFSRIVWGPPSEILDVGRASRRIPAGIRRALIIRDRYCAWKECERSPRWCDVHHLQSWIDDGKTRLPNLVLLCRYHHSLVHRYEGDIHDLLDLQHLEPEPAGRAT
jgi:hypothetical protein